MKTYCLVITIGLAALCSCGRKSEAEGLGRNSGRVSGC